MKQVKFLIICVVILVFFVSILNALEVNPQKKSALLLIDIQDFYFIEGKYQLVEPVAASLKAKKILNHFRKEKQLIIHIRHNTKVNADIHKNVLPLKNEIIITKNFANSFRDTKLLSFLKENQIRQLVICGMMTHMCVEAAVRAAADYGFKCILIEDACTTRDLKSGDTTIPAKMVHCSTLASLSRTYATVLRTQVFLDKN